MKRIDIIREVHELLGFPIVRNMPAATKVVRAVFDTIIGALQRGEEVSIAGLGIFRIRTRKPTRIPCHYFHPGRKKGTFTEVKEFPAKKYVHFKPATSILRTLNGR